MTARPVLVTSPVVKPKNLKPKSSVMPVICLLACLPPSLVTSSSASAGRALQTKTAA